MMSHNRVHRTGTASLPTFKSLWASPAQDKYQVPSFTDPSTHQQARSFVDDDNGFSLRTGLEEPNASEFTSRSHCPSPTSSVRSFELNLTPSSCASDRPPLPRIQDLSTTMSAMARRYAEQANMHVTFDINHRPPFQDPMETLGIQQYDVVKIKNVPFAVTIAEIKAFINRLTTSPLIRDHQQGYPVHIIMERSTGKTMDCFVEFQHKGAAAAAVRRAEDTAFEGKHVKMGSRRVDLEVSSEGELCSALFPRAKSVRWNEKTGIPTPVENQDPFSEGFQGFLTVEEVASICKHAANPQKSTFMQRCQQRVYESMISTLYKFPWHVPKHYSVNSRNFLWSTYMDLLRNLMARVQPDSGFHNHGTHDKEVGLSHTLLLEYVFAGLNVQMFSMRQKFMIVHASGSLAPGFQLQKQAMAWPFQTLIPSLNYASDVMDEWLNILDGGYQRCVVHGLEHGYEDYLTLSRDESGFLQIELSDSTRAMSFHNMISVEKGLMQVLVENGRKEYCLGYGLNYRPLKMWDHSSSVEDSSAIEASMDSLQLTRINDKSCEDSFDPDDDDLEPFPHSDYYSPPDCPNPAPGAGLNELYLVKPSLSAQNTATFFNPSTPSFVPSQPWARASDGQVRYSFDSANATEQTGHFKRDYGAGLPPSWVSPQKLHSTPAFEGTHVTPPASRNERQNSAARYDPFYSNASPQAPRRTSLQSRRSSASGSPAGSDGLNRAIGTTDSGEAGKSHVRTQLVHALPPKPVFGNIWGPTVLQATYTPKSATPNRRAFSAEIGSTSSRLLSEQGDLISTKAQPKNVESFTKDRARSDSLNDSKQIGGEEKASPWTYGSPSHGSKSRSSNGRKFVRVHATIDEEGDMSVAHRVEGDDEDAAADAGGASLPSWA